MLLRVIIHVRVLNQDQPFGGGRGVGHFEALGDLTEFWWNGEISNLEKRAAILSARARKRYRDSAQYKEATRNKPNGSVPHLTPPTAIR